MNFEKNECKGVSGMKQLMTRWGRNLDKKEVLQEYPRPNFVRESYLNLNGEWEYCINRQKMTDKYQGKILVPFSPETELSGVGRIVEPEDFLHYRKVFCLPEGFVKGRVLLHFGAVDQECVVFLNRKRLGAHKGGYLPFSFDITESLLEGENELTLCVKDKTEKSPHARGKQKLVRKGGMASIFYTPSSGIWKTVWMESVPEEYIEKIKITPDYDKSSVRIKVFAKGTVMQAKISISFQEQFVLESSIPVNEETEIPLKDFRAWTPDTPNLYDIRLQYGKDEVSTYFGMRKVEVKKDKKGILRFYLNNEPIFFNGVLDQGYWPESLLTPPSDEALKYDIVKLKELGYNTIRKHIKVESERFYYHCDKLGMLVWQDMPNGGGDYNIGFVTYLPNGLPWLNGTLKDNHYKWFKREDKAGREQYKKDLDGMIELLYNYPSVVEWTPFNEGWGQFDANKTTAQIREKDATRLINEACGWYHQGGGDMYSIHNYLRKLKVRPKNDRVVALTEFGGYAYPIEGHMACEKEFGYKAYRTAEELAESYRKLWEEEIIPNIRNGLSAVIYTQTSDIEEEINGVMTYDREIVKLNESVVKEMNKNAFATYEAETK